MTVANPLLQAVDSRVLNGRIITAIIAAKRNIFVVFKVIILFLIIIIALYKLRLFNVR